jgi:hypothetical protein
MLPHSFLNKRVPLPIHFNGVGKLAAASLYRDDWEANYYNSIYNDTKCLEKIICMIRTILKYQIVIQELRSLLKIL